MKNHFTKYAFRYALSCALVWCGVLVLYRVWRTDSHSYLFMFWNLLLALIPLWLGGLLTRIKNLPARLLLGLPWLAFFPNAPYIITDLIHLRFKSGVPTWYDLLLIASCAGTGLAMAYYSLRQLQRLFITGRHPLLGWLFSILVLLLSGFAIYLGRFPRLNSWDLFYRPMEVMRLIQEKIVLSQTWGVSIGFGALLLLGYLLYVAGMQSERDVT